MEVITIKNINDEEFDSLYESLLHLSGRELYLRYPSKEMLLDDLNQYKTYKLMNEISHIIYAYEYYLKHNEVYDFIVIELIELTINKKRSNCISGTINKIKTFLSL